MTAPAPSAPRENVMTRKIGPLATWVWVVIVAAIVIGWAYLRTGRQAATSSTPSSGQVPEFVNQTFTTVVPPEAEHLPPRTKKHHRRDRDHDEDHDKDDRQHRRRNTDTDDVRGGPKVGPPTKRPVDET